MNTEKGKYNKNHFDTFSKLLGKTVNTSPKDSK